MTQWIKSGTTDQYIHFTGPTGLSTFTVYSLRNGGAATSWAAPTVVEQNSTFMPGVYHLAADNSSQMTIAGGNLTETLTLRITATGWNGTTVDVVLFDPAEWGVNVASINGTAVLGTGATGDLWRG